MPCELELVFETPFVLQHRYHKPNKTARKKKHQGVSDMFLNNKEKGTTKSRICFVTAANPVQFQGSAARKVVRRYLRDTQKESLITKNSDIPQKVIYEDDKDDLEEKGLYGLLEDHDQDPKQLERKYGMWFSDAAFIKKYNQLLKPFMDTSKELPLFSNKRLWSTERLLLTLFKIYGRCTPAKYLTSILNSKDALLSYCCLPLMLKSIVDKESEAALELTSGRYEVFQRLNRRLQSRKLQTSDETIMCVKQQLFIDTHLGSVETVNEHIKGLHRMVVLRGGLSNLGLDGELGHFLKVHILLACVVMELPAPSIFVNSTTRMALYVDPISSASSRFVESPIYWNSKYLSSLVGTPFCTPVLHGSLCELRDLTEILLYDPVTSLFEHPAYLSVSQNCSRPLTLSNLNSQTLDEVRFVAIHESCRLAGLIYATAIAYHVPISAAVSVAAANFDLPNILENLASAIEKTSFTKPAVWGDMAGCFLWVAFIAGATIPKCVQSKDTKTSHEFDRLRIRLTAPIMFSMGFFHTEFAEEAFDSVKTMLCVQAKLA